VAARKDDEDRLARRHEFDPDNASKVCREDYDTFAEFFVAFRKYYFGLDTFPHLQTIIDAMERAGPGSVTMILLPPEWMKTTLLEDYVCACIAANPNERIAWLSEGQPLARKSLGRIARRMTDDAEPNLFMEHYGPFKDTANDIARPWNADFFTVLGARHDERDYTFATGGIKSTIRGARWQKIILDDVQSIRSLNETKRFVEIFRTDVSNRPGVLGRIFIIGSRVGPGDFYETLLAEDLVDELVCIPALDLSKPPGQQSNFPLQFDAEGNPVLLPDGAQVGWSDEQLAKKRKLAGEEGWARVYMQAPLSKAGSMVTEEDIARATQPDRAVGVRVTNEGIGSLDPALKRHAAFIQTNYDARHLYVVDAMDINSPDRNETLFAEIERETTRYRPSYWVIENNTLQSGYLVDDRFLDIQERFGFRSVSHHTGTQKADPTIGIPAMLNAIVRKEILFPGKGVAENHSFVMLFDQLIRWRPDVPTKMLQQDLVTSLWFNWTVWRKLREHLAPDAEAWQRTGMQTTGYRPTAYGFARTHLTDSSGNELSAPPRIQKTYEQTWAELSSR